MTNMVCPCPYCGGYHTDNLTCPYYGPYDQHDTSVSVWVPPVQYIEPRKGWLCPRCDRVNAPWKEQCDCSGDVKATSAIVYELGDPEPVGHAGDS
jgi:hypothetical protein